MKILIIDDHAIVRRGIVSLLGEFFDVSDIGEADDAREGLAAVTRSDWDLVLVDISMPGRNGLELIQDIKRERPLVPVLVISAHSERDYAVRALKSGAAGFVSKQSAPDVLVSAIQRVAAGRRYISPAVAEHLAGAMAGEAAANSHETLSNRELQVLQLIASGKTVKEISGDLALSEKTIATYRARLSEKMGLATNVELTRYAIQHGLVE